MKGKMIDPRKSLRDLRYSHLRFSIAVQAFAGDLRYSPRSEMHCCRSWCREGYG